MESSTTRDAPIVRFASFSDGGVRPAARCPYSVRSRRPSRESCAASASTCGLAFFPVAVRGVFAFDVFGFCGARDFVTVLPARFRFSAMRGVYGVEAEEHRGEVPDVPFARKHRRTVSVIILLADGVRPDTLGD